MYAVAIDGSTSSTGIAAFQKKEEFYTYQNHSVFSFEEEFGKAKYTKKTKTMSKTAYQRIHKQEKQDFMEQRVHFMITHIVVFLDQIMPKMIVMEDTYGQNDMMTLKMLSRIQGAVIGWGLQHQATVLLKAPSRWRKEVGIPLCDEQKVRYKREQLKQMSQQLVFDAYGLVVGDDAADAICMGLSLNTESLSI